MREPDEGIEVGNGTNIFSVYVRINTLNQIKYTPTLMHISVRERERESVFVRGNTKQGNSVF